MKFDKLNIDDTKNLSNFLACGIKIVSAIETFFLSVMKVVMTLTNLCMCRHNLYTKHSIPPLATSPS